MNDYGFGVYDSIRSDDWVTMNGEHVEIGKGGTITKGPSFMVGQNVSSIKKGATEKKAEKGAKSFDRVKHNETITTLIRDFEKAHNVAAEEWDEVDGKGYKIEQPVIDKLDSIKTKLTDGLTKWYDDAPTGAKVKIEPRPYMRDYDKPVYAVKLPNGKWMKNTDEEMLKSGIEHINKGGGLDSRWHATSSDLMHKSMASMDINLGEFIDNDNYSIAKSQIPTVRDIVKFTDKVK